MTEQQKKALSSIKRLNLRGVLGTKFGMSFDRNGFAACPFHEENKPSFHVWQSENGNWRWRCFGCGKSGDYIDFRQHSDNVHFHDALRLICSEEHIDLDAGYSASQQADSAVTYTYTDAKGNPLYRVKKVPPKQFYFERYVDGQWLPKLDGVSRTLYNLPALLNAKEVFLLEGEKDCETLKSLGFVATTMGSKNSWKHEFAAHLKGKDVCVCLDVGNEADAERIAKDIESVASSVRILKLPGLDHREQDITDWFEKMAGQAADEKANTLRQVVRSAQIRPKPSVSTFVPLAETILEFKARSIPERDIFMEFWLEREGLTVLGGDNKTGKSILAMNVALSLALGKDFLDFKIKQARRVLLVQQEISESAMQNRIDKLFVGLSEDSLQNLIMPRRPDRRWKLTNEKDRKKLGQIVMDNGIDLVIFDPFSTFNSLRENATEDMSTICDYLADMMKEYKIGIFVIHHYAKPAQVDRQGSQKLRGSIVLADRADAIITSTRLPGKDRKSVV